jgi:hypothetical protein
MSAEPPQPLQLVRTAIRLQVLQRLSENQFGELVKAVVDIGQRIMVIGGELHADEESFLIDVGSRHRICGVSTSTRPSTTLTTSSSSTP